MRHSLGVAIVVCAFLFSATLPLLAQSPTATVNGQVRDTSGSLVPDAEVQLVSELTNVKYPARTNSEGIYSIVNVPPGAYRLQVSKAGFKTIIQSNITLNVLDARAINFELPVGAVSEIVTVEAGAPLVDTESATVSTVVNREFAENLPMNGRSFQTLIQLTPGVVLTASNGNDGGQFSVNGQRADSNYFTVDGVSANVGIGAGVSGVGNGLAGALPSFNVQGGTNSLVSVDAMQEFRIQTSTYAPEFGRTPGGQISIVTRSGTNEWHGAAFDYLRNDVFDANDWFADFTNQPKPEERQNDFGGTVGGPMWKDHTFFFFSYEGLRLRLPQVGITTVPDLQARQSAASSMQPYLNAFPLPNGPEVLAPDQNGVLQPTGSAQLNASFSNRSTLDAYSMRIDHRLNTKLNLFARYNYSPSDLVQRGSGLALSDLEQLSIATETATLGAAWTLTPTILNDFRFNYSRVQASGQFSQDTFGGAVPLTNASLGFPSPFNVGNSQLSLDIALLTDGQLVVGRNVSQAQHQLNFVDTLSSQRGAHSLKFGVDFRRLSPQFDPQNYLVGIGFFGDMPSVESGITSNAIVSAARGGEVLFHNLSLFGQDTWRLNARLTLTYGLRWDVDFAPSAASGPALPAVINFDNLSEIALAPPGTPVFKTTYGNVAPRIGAAYQLLSNQNWQTVVRGGFGVFYNLATQETGQLTAYNLYPYGTANPLPAGTQFPLNPTLAQPPEITSGYVATNGLFAFNPNLKLPYTLQWNIALEQGLGTAQTISVSYVGASGHRLLESEASIQPNPNVAYAQLVTNAGFSNYNALQVQFQRRLSLGLQVLASYTWAHSIDTASAGSAFGNEANALLPGEANANRGPSDFDIRNTVSAAVSYEVPLRTKNTLTNMVLHGWSLHTIIQARSAPPLNVSDGNFYQLNNYLVGVRPDVVPGQSLYLYGAQCVAYFGALGLPCPGGKGLNPAAFTNPPTDSNGNPLRQGTLTRNALRGFGATQWDFAIHRDFPIHESLRLQFRSEMFNVLNHPNFGPPYGSFGYAGFGVASQMLGRSLDQYNQGNGSFSPLYQMGGPRSIQFALKLLF